MLSWCNSHSNSRNENLYILIKKLYTLIKLKILNQYWVDIDWMQCEGVLYIGLLMRLRWQSLTRERVFYSGLRMENEEKKWWNVHKKTWHKWPNGCKFMERYRFREHEKVGIMCHHAPHWLRECSCTLWIDFNVGIIYHTLASDIMDTNRCRVSRRHSGRGNYQNLWSCRCNTPPPNQ